MLYAHGKTGVIQTKIVNDDRRGTEDHFVLSEAEVVELARWGALIEEHYSERAKTWTPMDMEWAKDGKTNELYHRAGAARDGAGANATSQNSLNTKSPDKGKELVRGISVGSKVATGHDARHHESEADKRI